MLTIEIFEQELDNILLKIVVDDCIIRTRRLTPLPIVMTYSIDHDVFVYLVDGTWGAVPLINHAMDAQLRQLAKADVPAASWDCEGRTSPVVSTTRREERVMLTDAHGGDGDRRPGRHRSLKAWDGSSRTERAWRSVLVWRSLSSMLTTMHPTEGVARVQGILNCVTTIPFHCLIR